MGQDEKIVEIKLCRHCNSEFEITDKDLEFYEKVSPAFGGKKYTIPAPTLCPDCRQQKRLSFRNERKLYKRICDATGKPIISIYSPDKPYKVYNQDFWWSDKWEALDYGKDFDFSKSFFEQFKDLFLKVPKISMINNHQEKSEYCNQTTGMKNSYLCFNAIYSENCLYCKGLSKCESTLDSLRAYSCEECYECIDCHNCYKGFHLRECIDCVDSFLCKECIGCTNCIGCFGLRNKQYLILNIQYSQTEYFQEIEKFKSTQNKEVLFKEFEKLIFKFPNKFGTFTNCEKYSGNNLHDSKDTYHSYDVVGGEDVKFCYDLRATVKCSYDISTVGDGVENSYYTISSGINMNHCLFSAENFENVNNLMYCIFSIHGSNNCFGCVGLRNKSYCILNKQYTKEEYEKLVPKIIEYMQKTGEWGEFFPSSLSPFGYNETVAEEYFPLTKEEALKQWFNWSDYEPPFPKVDKIIPASKLPENIGDIPDDILNWAIECEITKKPFRIIKEELAFYRKHNLPIPRRHPDQRHLDRMKLRNPRKLYKRACHKCRKDIETTYAPERLEIVYCEECYNKEVY